MSILLLSPIIINDDDPPVIVCSVAPSTQLTTNFRRSFSSFSLSSVALQLVRMPAFTANPEFFGENPEGICSGGMAKKAGVVFREGDGKYDELLPLVASGVPKTAAKVKMQFGHQVPKQVAKHHGVSSPFYSTLAVLHLALTDKLTTWNPPAVATPLLP
jgi:hypothetical protein